MELKEILIEVNKIFVDVLENEEINIEFGTTARDIDEWDSLNNMQLIVEIEKHFKIRFNSKEVGDWQNVGDMCETIQKKISE